MTKEIHKLAEKYADEVWDGDTDFIDEAENVITWLLQKYVILNKDAIREIYNNYIEDKDSDNILIRNSVKAVTTTLESIFGKELFMS